ncbi:MAG: HAMP domain-containing histidine kinase [Spirochaetales bacterium]|nr:HAMP domain-containing histidine kinase [Spirochaetales bacterium]
MKSNEETSLSQLLPFFVFIAIFLLLFFLKSGGATKRVQVIFLLLISYFTIMTNPVTNQVGYLLLIFIYFLSKKYRIFTSAKLYHTSLLILLVLSIVVSFMNYGALGTVSEELTIWHLPNELAFLAATVILIFIVFEDDIKRLTLENQKLNTQIEKSRVFVNLGENISGLVHNMNGDLGLMTMAASMLEEEVDHKAVEFVQRGNKNLQAKIRNILTLAKYSQAEADMEFSINALLYSLLEVFNINRQFRIVTTKTDFIDEVFFYGNPSEISQVFENLLKNAYEALVEHKKALEEQGMKDFDALLSVGISGKAEVSIITFKDNGPGIRACLEKNCKGECSGCDVFKVGRTTKIAGTGLGMISVRRTLDKYGASMKIRTSSEGTQITITLARG